MSGHQHNAVFSVIYIFHAACLLNPTLKQAAVLLLFSLSHISFMLCLSSEPNVKTGCSAARRYQITALQVKLVFTGLTARLLQPSRAQL